MSHQAGYYQDILQNILNFNPAFVSYSISLEEDSLKAQQELRSIQNMKQMSLGQEILCNLQRACIYLSAPMS
jgi:hypothetical protein